MRPLRVVDVYAGRRGLSNGFAQRGHDVVSIDNDEDGKFGSTITMDAVEFSKDPWRYLRAVRPEWDSVDVVLGGPPCTAFSVLTIGRNWHPPPTHAPKTEAARVAVQLVQAFMDTVRALRPRFWWMENPRAKLRSLPIMKGVRRTTVTYCQYGTTWQKPTDLWGVWPASWRPKPMCKPMATCHVSAPAGSRTPGSIQGQTGRDAAALRAEAPISLSLSPLPSPVRTQPRTEAAWKPSGA